MFLSMKKYTISFRFCVGYNEMCINWPSKNNK